MIQTCVEQSNKRHKKNKAPLRTYTYMKFPEVNTPLWHCYHMAIATALLVAVPYILGWYSVAAIIAIAAVIVTVA